MKRKKRRRKLSFIGKITLFALIVIFLLLIIAIINLLTPDKTVDEKTESFDFGTKEIPISFLAVGDDLIHGPIYRQAKARTTDGSFDFSPAYQNIVPYLEGYDFKIINQETPLGGEELGLSSYPMFNSPTQLGSYLTSIGFNVISHANNHVLDAGTDGLANTINFWKTQAGTTMTGIYENATSANQLQIMEKDGVKVAFLAYTYGTNGLSLPAQSPYVINYIDQTKIQSDIAKAEEAADITVVIIHWGNEYEPNANENQKSLAQMMANCDADIIIGSHPHVIQDVSTLPQADGGKCLCYYSLGNFISAQDKKATMLGGMASIKTTYDVNNDQINFEKVEFIPIVNQYNEGFTNIHIVPLADYTDEMAAEHGVSGLSKSYFEDLVYQTVNRQYVNIR